MTTIGMILFSLLVLLLGAGLLGLLGYLINKIPGAPSLPNDITSPADLMDLISADERERPVSRMGENNIVAPS